MLPLFLHGYDPAAFKTHTGNAAAFRAVMPDELRRNRSLWLHGEAGSGKTHLLHVCAGRFPSARLLDAADLASASGVDWFGTHLLLDNADRLTDEALLLHVVNAVRQGGGVCVLTAKVPPGQLPLRDESLVSRLLSMQAIEIKALGHLY